VEPGFLPQPCHNFYCRIYFSFAYSAFAAMTKSLERAAPYQTCAQKEMAAQRKAATRFISRRSGTLPNSKRPAPQYTSAHIGHRPRRAPENMSPPGNTIGLPLPQSPTSAHLESAGWGVHLRGTQSSTPLPLFSRLASLPTALARGLFGIPFEFIPKGCDAASDKRMSLAFKVLKCIPMVILLPCKTGAPVVELIPPPAQWGTGKRAVIYTRISTGEQHAETQLYDLRELAEQRRFEIIQEYTDTISAPKSKGPGLEQLLSDARRHRFDVVTLWKDGDPDIPLLKHANTEYAKLQ
jgi:hypothetical protein